MKYILIILMVFVYICNFHIGYSHESPAYSHFLYMFQHAGIIHLIINSISLFSFLTTLRKVIPRYRIFIHIYIGAVVASYCSVNPIQTVGASGMIYTLLGIYITLALFGKKLIIKNKRIFAFWLTFTLLSSIILAFNPNINSMNHLTAFGYGIITGIGENFTKQK